MINKDWCVMAAQWQLMANNSQWQKTWQKDGKSVKKVEKLTHEYGRGESAR